jgi:hypothetical protein
VARQTIERLIDDLDGNNADETVHFGLDGIAYEIDLSARNAAAFRKAISKYQEAGQRVSVARRSARRAAAGTTSASANRAENTAIREWAKKKGRDISDRGRIPQALVDEYRAANRR